MAWWPVEKATKGLRSHVEDVSATNHLLSSRDDHWYQNIENCRISFTLNGHF